MYLYDRILSKIKAKYGYNPISIYNFRNEVTKLRITSAEISHILRELKKENKIKIKGKLIKVI